MIGSFNLPVVLQPAATRNVLLAFRPRTAARQFRFSHDGLRLAIAYDDGTLELRPVPATPSDGKMAGRASAL